MLIGAGGVVFLALLMFVIVALLTHPFNTPFHHGHAQLLHALVWQASGRVVGKEWDTYSGVVRMWDDRGRLSSRQQYRDGERHGVWVDYDTNGAIERVHEYRDGKPWNGVCYIAHMKSFQAEYRSGKPWNGVTWYYDKKRTCSVDQFWVDGAEVSEAEYGSPPLFTHQQLTRPQNVVLPID
ncbi:hypothetical protein MalM25_26070 [Planctomycetes bacterium MalM25]|nr:hypothetical protein MalM25_26070 [Planctomycetes bacterium MalM25]